MPALPALLRRKKSPVDKFYELQSSLERQYKDDLDLLERAVSRESIINREETNMSQRNWDNRMAQLSLAINVLMLCAKIVASVLSHSLAVVSSSVDSAMDIAASLVIWLASRAAIKSNSGKYPVGMSRLEPLMVIVVAMCMIFANLFVIQESVSSTISRNLAPIVDIETIVILCTGTALKIMLFILCRLRGSTATRLLALDHRNDICTNIIALAGAYIGHRWWVYADPLGACIISVFIVYNWVGEAREQIPLLVGRSADREFINRIVRIATTHDDRIEKLDMIYVYHFGANFLVELHVLMDPSLSLKDAHDVSESLQTKLEHLPFVDRAFVHSDYQLDGDEHIRCS